MGITQATEEHSLIRKEVFNHDPQINPISLNDSYERSFIN